MINKLALAAAVAVLAGCAANPQVATTGTSSARSSGTGTYYCWKERLNTEGDSLVCNWEASASDACRSTGVTTIKRSTVASGPSNSTLCTNGQWLVAVTTR